MAERASTSRSVRESLAPEVRLALIEAALDQGNARFDDLKGRLAVCETKLEPPKPTKAPLLPYVLGILSILSIAGNWLWSVARYPERAEIERADASLQSKIEHLDDKGREIALELARLKTQLEERARAALEAAAAAKTAAKKAK